MASSLYRRLAAISASGATVVALVVVPLSGADAADDETLTLLNINDFHGRISPKISMGLAYTVQSERAAAPGDSMLLSAGDNVGASLYASSVQKDQPTIDFLNALGLQATAVGNHEFDGGAADLFDRIIPGSDFVHLGANVIDKATGEPAVDPYFTYTTESGTTVAVIGAVTTETPQLTDPSQLATLEFIDPVAAVNKYADVLSDSNPDNGEADVIIAEYHEGVDVASSATDAIVNGTSANVDVIFTGHTHEEYVIDGAVPGQPGKTRPVVQTGNYGDNLGKVVLSLGKDGEVNTYSASLVDNMGAPSAEQIAADPVLVAANTVVTAADAYAAEKGSVVAGQVTGPITTGYKAGEVAKGGFDMRDMESTMGHLVADMYLHAANSTGRTPADIGIVNPGGLRDELPGGLRSSLAAATNRDVRVMDIVNVTPFANNLWTTQLTGAQLKSVLEEQWQQDSSGNMATRPYLQLGFSSNVTYTYTGATGAEGYATRGGNIRDIYVNGKRVEPTDVYTVAIPSFLLGGGDNFGTLAQGSNARDTALVDSDAFVSYFESLGSVDPNYAKQAVKISGVAESYSVEGNLTFELSDLHVQSYGVPVLTELKVLVGGVELGTVPVVDGVARVDVALAGKGVSAGVHDVVLVDATGAAGTLVTAQMAFYGSSVEPVPSPEATPEPTPEPTVEPTVAPTPAPTAEPTSELSVAPTVAPTIESSVDPTVAPIAEPSVAPSVSPTAFEYENCAAVWDDLGRPIGSDEAGFHKGLDSDGDGTGCEQNPDYTNPAKQGGSGNGSGSAGSSGKKLAHTGFTALAVAGAGALALTAGAGALAVARRRSA